jgi:hypothetical protein
MKSGKILVRPRPGLSSMAAMNMSPEMAFFTEDCKCNAARRNPLADWTAFPLKFVCDRTDGHLREDGDNRRPLVFGCARDG